MKAEFKLRSLLIKIGFFILAFSISEAVPPGNNNFVDTYDFIVVGSGVAGCVLASRLSENGKHTVLLLEVGGYPDPRLSIPGLVPSLLTPEVMKMYPTVPQKHVARQNGGIVLFPTGRIVGGGSSDNSMVFNRGNPLDYDNWANLTGDQSWSYANMLPYFRRVEDYKGRFPLTNEHGVGGPITISRPNYAPGLKEWASAGRSLGYPVADANGPQLQQDSFTPLEYSKRVGRRVSAYTGYILPVLNKRSNLKLITRADVRRILFERDHSNNLRATGVLYVTTSPQNQTSLVTVQARKEVIVSAGVIGSPTLLLRSGVGPVQALKQAGVPVTKYLPVGENLHDQVFVQMDFIVKNTTVVFDRNRDLNPQAWELYKKTGDGPYSTDIGATAQAFFSSSQTALAWPDLQIFLLWGRGAGQIHVSRINSADLRPGETPVFCLAALTRPKSRGTLTLNATSIDVDPLVDFNYLDDPQDEVALIESVNKALGIFEKAATYRNLGARYNPRPFPACQHLLFRSVAYWKCYIKQTGTSWLHGAGSCKMGVATSPDSVVDTELKVIGISGLRVVDASVMPAVTNANTQAPVYAIAEKASDMILRKWNNYANFENKYLSFI